MVMNDLVNVYRVQNADGYGPYAFNVSDVINSPEWTVLDTHIDPVNDIFENGISPDEVCAFDTVQLARQWFSESMVNLLSHDEKNEWFLAMYKIPRHDVRYGMVQVLINPDTAVFVDAVPVERLYS